MEITCGILRQHHLKENKSYNKEKEKKEKRKKEKELKGNHIIKEINKDGNNLVKGHVKSVDIKPLKKQKMVVNHFCNPLFKSKMNNINIMLL